MKEKTLLCELRPAVLRDMSNQSVKIICSYFGDFWIFMIIIQIYNSCLDILFGHWPNFCKWYKKLQYFDCSEHIICEQYFDHVWRVILYLTCRAGQPAHDSKCVNKVYKAYMINGISYKKSQDLTFIWGLLVIQRIIISSHFIFSHLIERVKTYSFHSVIYAL